MNGRFPEHNVSRAGEKEIDLNLRSLFRESLGRRKKIYKAG